MTKKNFWETSGPVTERWGYIFNVLPKPQGWISPKDTLWEFWDIWWSLEAWHLCKQAGFGLSQHSQNVCHQELCAFGSAPVPCTQTLFAKSWQLLPCWLPPPTQGAAEMAPLWVELLTQEYISLSCTQTHPCCCELMLGLAFYGCWWTGNSSERGDGGSHSTPVPLFLGRYLSTHRNPSAGHTKVIFLWTSLWNVLPQFGSLALLPVSSHTKTSFS